MALYDYLPGIQVDTVDGNLQAKRNPSAQAVVVIGTSAKGSAEVVYPVTDRPLAGSIYGFDGTLLRGMEEVSVYSDNVYLFRMGTKPAKVTGLGKETGAGAVAGFDVEFSGDRSAEAGKNYKVYCDEGILYVFYKGSIVFANDTGVQVVDTSDVVVTGAGAAGKGLVVGSAKTWEGAIALEDLDALVAAGTTPVPVFIPAVDGLGMTMRETYVALCKALELLETYHVQHVYCPNVVLDAKNVALGGTPETDPDCLDWLKTWEDANGETVYHWASEANDSQGSVVVAHGAWTDGADRIGDGYREVNFGYRLASFAAKLSKVNAQQGGCVAFIGMTGPKALDLATLRAWVGKAPVTDPISGLVTTSGKGLLGNAYMVGAAPGTLHALCADKVSGRQPGFFENDADAYDGGASYDRNFAPIDIGAYLHVAADWATLRNGYGSYFGNIAGMVCGFVSSLDPKSSPTNKELVGVTQRNKFSNGQLNALTKARINMLRFEDFGEIPRMLHGMTAALPTSDYDRLVRLRVKFLAMKLTAKTANPFIGESSTDGLQLQALRTALDRVFSENAKRGYWQRVSFSITSSAAEQKLGHANIDLNIVNPAEELVQLRASVGLSRG